MPSTNLETAVCLNVMQMKKPGKEWQRYTSK